jgi:hypothetical protein
MHPHKLRFLVVHITTILRISVGSWGGEGESATELW